MHTIHKITDSHLHCLDDNDYEYIIDRGRFEQWIIDNGKDRWLIDEYEPETGHRQTEGKLDWYEFGDISNDLKQYCKTQHQFIIREVEAQREIS